MKAIFAGFATIVLITIGAWYVLGQSGFSSAERYSSENVRLD
jgi:hypothetical protein